MNRKSPHELLTLIAQVIYDKKGINILALDVRGLSNLTDFMVIAEGNVDRHVTSIAKSIIEALQESNERPLHTEGLQTGDWVVLDYGQIMIHIFSPGLRNKYALEKLWGESKIVDVDIDISSAARSL